jgi:hypothetical protein
MSGNSVMRSLAALEHHGLIAIELRPEYASVYVLLQVRKLSLSCAENGLPTPLTSVFGPQMGVAVVDRGIAGQRQWCR